MKRLCFPVRGDHNLLTPETQAMSGVQLHPITQVRLGGMPYHLARLKDFSIHESAAGSQHLAASASRRLRFEDETETEAESRYQERQTRQVWTQETRVLVSKPSLKLFVGDRARRQVVEQGSGVRASLRQQPSAGADREQRLYRTHLHLWTEPIRETYIGSATPGETRGGGASCGSDVHARRKTHQVEVKRNDITYITDLPINPYAPDKVAIPMSTCPANAPPPPVTSSMTSLAARLNSIKDIQEVKLSERNPCVDIKKRNSASSYLPAQVEPTMMSQISSESPADSQTAATSKSSSDGQFKQPIRAEDQRVNTTDQSSPLYLHHPLSDVRLSRTRSGSLDQLSVNPQSPASNPRPPGNREPSSLLKKSLSVQSLGMGAPFLKLRKSSSIQNFGSEHRKKEHSADRFLPRSLTIEDVGRPGSSHSVGRVLQVCSDGTFQLELSRPPRGTFDFIISQRRGCPDSGVYVEDMLDCRTEKLYSGLLSIGDKILEVNGKSVAGLSVDQITLLLTQKPSVIVRVLRHQRPR